MHKAKIFLLAVFSLIMLVPFGNGINTNSNATALTQDLYPDMTTGSVDYSQYDRFYKDDNFRENYYNYHKQQHHQSQPSSYDHHDYDKYGTDETVQYVNDMADYVEDKYQPYAKDNNHIKSQNSDFVKKIKCNNINVNVNGLELDVFPPFLADSGLAAEAVEGNTAPNSVAGNGASEFNDFRFICINNNNNTVVGEEEEALITCEDCFINNLNDEQLHDFEDALERSGFTLESFCEFLSNPEISNDQKTTELVQIISDAGLAQEDLFPAIDCVEASTIFDFAERGG